jgi:hypothetical protein
MSEILFTLYKGKIKGKFLGSTEEKPNRHMYYIEGKRKTGMTTYLGIKDKSEALKSYVREQTVKNLLPKLKAGGMITEKDLVTALYSDEANTSKAADLGHRIHEWIENYINHKINPKKCPMPEMPDDPSVAIGAASFMEWESEHKVKFIWSEKIVYSLKHDFIGKADFAAKVDGLICLCDIKTGNGMYNSVRAQTAGYVMADMEESKTKYDGRWAIRIAKETKEEYETRMALKNEIRAVLGKETQAVEPYQIFEAMFLDNDKKAMKEDMKAAVDHVSLHRWNAKTDFWKIKNGAINGD